MRTCVPSIYLADQIRLLSLFLEDPDVVVSHFSKSYFQNIFLKTVFSSISWCRSNASVLRPVVDKFDVNNWSSDELDTVFSFVKLFEGEKTENADLNEVVLTLKNKIESFANVSPIHAFAVDIKSKNIEKDVDKFLSEHIDYSIYKKSMIDSAKLGFYGILKSLIKKGAYPFVQDEDGNTLLHLASRSGITDIIEDLVSIGINVNCRNKDGQTPLQLSILNRREEIANKLIDLNADFLSSDNYGVNSVLLVCAFGSVSILQSMVGSRGFSEIFLSKDKNGLGVVHYSCIYGNVDVLRELLQRSVDIHETDMAGNTGLHLAVMNHKRSIVSVLLEHDVDISRKNNAGKTALHIAVESDSDVIVLDFCNQNIDINIQNLMGDTCLHTSVTKLDILNILLSFGADPNIINIKGLTPLHISCRDGLFESCDIILSYNPNIFITDFYGNNALHFACRKGCVESINYLLRFDQDSKLIQCKNFDGKTVLHMAVYSRKLDAVKIILDSNDKIINEQDLEGSTALMISTVYGMLDIFSYIFMKNASIYLKDRAGNNCLHLACIFNKFAIAKKILDADQNISKQKNFKGQLPLHLACKSGSFHCLSILLAMYSNINEQDLDGNTPLHFAAEIGDINIINILLKNDSNTNIVNSNGESAFDIAFRNGFFDIANILQ